MTTITRKSDYRLMAVEHTSDDMFDVAEQSAALRLMVYELLAMLADRDRRLERSRECYTRLRDENRRLRASIMHTDVQRAA